MLSTASMAMMRPPITLMPKETVAVSLASGAIGGFLHVGWWVTGEGLGSPPLHGGERGVSFFEGSVHSGFGRSVGAFRGVGHGLEERGEERGEHAGDRGDRAGCDQVGRDDFMHVASAG